jgi:allantoin racemase
MSSANDHDTASGAGGASLGTILYYVATGGYDGQERQRRLAEMAPFVPAGYRVVIVTAIGGPTFLDRPDDFQRATDVVSAQASQLGPDQGDVIVMGGALDPGLPTVRLHARLPVVGPGEAALFLAAVAGQPLSILVQDDAALDAGQRLVDQTRVKPLVVSVRAIGVPVRAIVRDLDGGRQALQRTARAAVEKDGAQAILLGSMTLPTLGLTSSLRADLGVPIYDPLRIAIRTAVEIIDSRKPATSI